MVPKLPSPNAASGSLSTTGLYRQLHIQHVFTECQHTSFNMLTLMTDNATPTHKVPANIVLDLTQPELGAV